MDNSGKKYDKIFCIGANKTGTTSLGHTLKQLGFNLGNQRHAESKYLSSHVLKSHLFIYLLLFCGETNL